MSYSPPNGGAIPLRFGTAVYTPPNGGAIPLVFDATAAAPVPTQFFMAGAGNL